MGAASRASRAERSRPLGLHRDGRVALEAEQKRASFAHEVERAADDDHAPSSRRAPARARSASATLFAAIARVPRGELTGGAGVAPRPCGST